MLTAKEFQIRQALLSGLTHQQIAKQFDVNCRVVQGIANKRLTETQREENEEQQCATLYRCKVCGGLNRQPECRKCLTERVTASTAEPVQSAPRGGAQENASLYMVCKSNGQES